MKYYKAQPYNMEHTLCVCVFLAPKLGTSGDFAHGLVDTISKGPSMRELKLLHSNVNDDDTGYAESGGMIQPLYK